LKEDEDDMSLKYKRDIVVSKLMYDKAIIIDHELDMKFSEEVKSSVFLAMSNDSRKVLLNQESEYNQEFNTFHRLIGFNLRKEKSYDPITNEDIMNLSQKLIRFKDCKNIYLNVQ